MSTKKYTLIVDDNFVNSIEINGKKYKMFLDIPDNIDQQKVERMIEAVTGFYKDEDFETRTTGSIEKIFFSVFLTIAVVMLTIAVLSGISTMKRIASEQSFPGRVTSFYVHEYTDGSRYYYPEVAISMPDGTINTRQMNEGSSPPAYDVGQRVTVLYDPAHPDQARIQSAGSSFSLWILTLITGAFGLVFVAGAVIAFVVLKPKLRRAKTGKELLKQA